MEVQIPNNDENGLSSLELQDEGVTQRNSEKSLAIIGLVRNFQK